MSFYNRIRFKLLPKMAPALLGVQTRDDLTFLGSTYGGWHVPSSLLNADSIVYCVGCGEDVSFDLALIERFGCEVHAFDPTPRAIAHVQTHAQHPKYHFKPLGLWNENTQLTFYLNDNPANVSGSITGLAGTKNQIQVEVRTLDQLMRDNGHQHIDLLKIDIEGAEYVVLNDMLTRGVHPRCICVEFDQPAPFSKTREMVRNLKSAGYELCKINVWDYVFVHKSN